MKWIKLFEEYTQEWGLSVENTIFIEFLIERFLKDYKRKELVQELLSGIRYRTLSGPRMHSCAGDRVEHEGVRSEYDPLAPGLSRKDIKPQSIFSFEILKMPDEWFWIEVENQLLKGNQGVRMEKTQSYFKCDGFFGLKKFLEKKLTQHE